MKKILLMISAIFLLLVNVKAQNRTISGKITDDQGQPLSGVSVEIKGTKVGTATNAQGEYTLSVPANAKTLVFTSVNMETREVSIASGNFSVSLVPKANELDAVVVTVPYGTIKKKAFTGSENTIGSATITKQQVTSVTRTIEGLVPGVVATNGGGAPGTGASIRIRGVGSVSSSSEPLYVLNGVPYDGSIAAISNDDVESITVLKDAAAAALYGSRAANGVIMITTKKGRKGKPMVSLSVRQGFETRGIPEYDRIGAKEYYELSWEAYRNSYVFASGQSYAQAGINASNVLTGPNGLVYNAYNVPGNKLVDSITGKLNPAASLLWNESWEDALFHQAPRTSANFSVSGASESADYFLSVGYLSEKGILRNSDYKRYNTRLNVNVNATSWLNAGLNIDGAFAKRSDLLASGSFTSNPFYYSRNMGPIYPVYQHDLVTGAIILDSLGNQKLDWGTAAQMGGRPYAGNSNLVGSLELDDRSRNIFNGNANTFAEIKFPYGFALKGTFGINYVDQRITTYQNNQYGDAASVQGRSTKQNATQFSYTANEILSWTKSIGKNNIRALAGHENYKFKSDQIGATVTGFLFPGQTELDNGSVSGGPASSSVDNLTIESYLANVNYDYDQKYLLSGSYRTDGSSRFAKDVRWGKFYSVGLGWRVSQEKFMQNVKWLNELKLRGSYGESGNENIGTGLLYQYGTYYYSDGLGGYTPLAGRLSNEGLLWEHNNTTNIGVDFSLFKNRLTGTVEWFNRVSKDLLFDVPLQTSTNPFSVNYQNIGTMKNYGFEVQLGYNVIMKREFNWRVDVNLTKFKNKITKLPPNQVKTGVPGTASSTQRLFIDGGIFDFWVPEYAGVDASNGDALYYKYALDADGNKTGEKFITNVYVNDNSTRVNMGTSLPKFSGGLTNSFNYKGFDLSILTTFSYGGLYYDGNYAGLMTRAAAGTAWHTDILNRWQKPGDVTNVPRLQNAIAGQDGISSRWLVDGSWLNIKNITLSYTIAKALANRMHLAGLQIYANVDNAWLFTAKKGIDPQRDFSGTSDASYTPYRTVSVGFTVNLQ